MPVHVLHLGSSFLVAFSVCIISSFMYALGFCSRAYWCPKFNIFICSGVNLVLVWFITLGCVGISGFYSIL